MKKRGFLVFGGICLIGLMLLFSSKVGVWTWARGATPRNIIIAEPWNNGEDLAALSAEETAELISLLNNLQLRDFTKNNRLTGGTPTYGVQLQTGTGVLYLNEAFAPDGGLEIRYGGAQWWINDPALCDFVREKAMAEN